MSVERRFLFPSIEKLTRPELLVLQERRLIAQIRRCAMQIPFYTERWSKRAASIRSYDEFRELIPFTSKADFISTEDSASGDRCRAASCGPLAAFHLTSGTSGLGQEVHPLTQFDVEAVASTWPYQAHWAGLDFADRVAYTFPVGLQAGGLWSPPANDKLGSLGLQLAPYGTQKKLEYLLRFKPHGIVIAPAFLNRFQALLEAEGKDPRKLMPNLKAVFIAGESYSLDWAKRAQEFWGARLSEWYGCMQGGINLAFTAEEGALCQGERGVLLCMEHRVLCEVLEPGTDRPVEPGEEGEIVITNLFREAFPVIRFRTGDRVRLSSEPAPGGRPFLGLEAGTIARYDDMMKIRGQNLWPDAVDRIVFSKGDVEEYQGVVAVEMDGRESIRVAVEFKPSAGMDAAAGERRCREIAAEIKSGLNLSMDVSAVEPLALPRYEFKVRRWLDKRRGDLKVVRYTSAN